MSGGHFDYNQYRIREIADEVRNLIDINNSPDLDSFGYSIAAHYPPEVIKRFKEAYMTLRKAEIMVQCVDLLVSGDDGEDSFLQRWDEKLENLNKEQI